MRFEDTLRRRPVWAVPRGNTAMRFSEAERDALAALVAEVRNFTDGPGDLASLVDALARLDGAALYDAGYVEHDEQGRPRQP